MLLSAAPSLRLHPSPDAVGGGISTPPQPPRTEGGALDAFSSSDLESIYSNLYLPPTAEAPSPAAEETAASMSAPRSSTLFGWKRVAAALALIGAGIGSWLAFRSNDGSSAMPAPETASKLVASDTPPAADPKSSEAAVVTTAGTPENSSEPTPPTESPAPVTTTATLPASEPAAPVAAPKNPVLDELARAMKNAPVPATSEKESTPTTESTSATAPEATQPVPSEPTSSPVATEPEVMPVAPALHPESAVRTAPLTDPATAEITVLPAEFTPSTPALPITSDTLPPAASAPVAEAPPATPVPVEFVAPRGSILTPGAPIELRFMGAPTGNRPRSMPRLEELFPEGEEPVLPNMRRILGAHQSAPLEHDRAALSELLPESDGPFTASHIHELKTRSIAAPRTAAVRSDLTLDELMPSDEDSTWLQGQYQSIKKRNPTAVTVRKNTAPATLASNDGASAKPGTR